MKQLFQWILANPTSFKGFLTAFLAMLIKLILQLSGKSEQLAQWNDAINQVLDLIVYAVTAYGVVSGGIHAARGPTLTTTDQASVIVAALAPTPVAAAVETVKTIVADVVAVKVPPAETIPLPHKF